MLPFRRARLSTGFGSLGAAACRREALGLSSVCSGWTPRGIWEFYMDGCCPSPPPLSLPPAPGWLWTLDLRQQHPIRSPRGVQASAAIPGGDPAVLCCWWPVLG